MAHNSRPAVCIIVENNPVPLDWRVWQEARALSEAGYPVSIICPKGPGYESGRETVEGIEIYRHPVWKANGRLSYLLEYFSAFVAEFYLAWKVYLRTRFGILQGCNPPDTIFLIALAFKPLGVRFVFDHHDLSPELYETKFGRSGLIYKIVCLAERLTFRVADLSIATNEAFRDVAIERGKIEPERVVVVQTCADLGEVSRAHPVPELKRGKRFMVAYVGVIEAQDGVQLLIQSIAHLVKQKQRNDTHFVLIGSGSELPALRTSVTQLGVDDFVEFTGWLPHEQVSSYLSTADVCVTPDPLSPLNDKCTMIKNLEYLAHSRPVVSYDLKEGRRTLGGAALYARHDDPMDFADQIEKLLESEPLRRQLGECGGKRTKEGLNWKAQSAKLIAAFDWLLNKD